MRCWNRSRPSKARWCRLTGSLAYVLNGALGVSRHELETDRVATFYPEMPDDNEDLKCWRRESHFNDGFAKYGDADTPWNDRIVIYLKDCGITDEEIAAFRGSCWKALRSRR